MKPLRYILLIAAALLLLPACSGSDDPTPEPVDPTPEPFSRTVLVYMAANNSPALPHARNFSDMVAAVDAGALGDLGRLVVFSKTSASDPPELIELTPQQQTVLKEYPVGTNTVDPYVMKQVIADVRALAPAQEYGLLLWSHASGWRSPSRSWGQDVDSDTGTKREMSIPDLALALGNHQFSFIYMDCCFMGNIETLYELRNAADYVIASATETPYYGMDYANNIPEMFSQQLDLKNLVTNTYNVVAQQTRTGDNCGIAIALYDMANVANVAAAVKAIYATSAGAPVNTASIQQYGFGTSWSNYFFDLRHYMSALVGGDDVETPPLLAAFDVALGQFIPLFLATDMIWEIYSLENAHGVSVFIPGSSERQTTYHYDELQWYRDVVAPYFTAADAA